MTLTEQLTAARAEVARIEELIKQEQSIEAIMTPSGGYLLDFRDMKDYNWFCRESREEVKSLARTLELLAKADLIAKRCGERPFVDGGENWYGEIYRGMWHVVRTWGFRCPFVPYFDIEAQAERFWRLMGDELKGV